VTAEAALALRRLPGNTPWESALIQQWIRDEGHKYRDFQFNVRIGTALDPGPAFHDAIRAGSIANTQKRIDCVAFTLGGVYIVEGKIVLDIRIYGQFEGYRHIVERDFPDQVILGYIAVAHSNTPDTVSFLRSKGVAVFLYPSVLAPRAG
jgi:hypothetical protein